MDSKENDRRARAIVQSLASVVESMIQPIDSVPNAHLARTKFEAFRAPGISVRDYLMRIQKYASCSAECFVLALVYIDRLHSIQGLQLTELNVHRILITSVVLAAKFFDDHYFNNAYYAKVGGVPCAEMNELEVEYLIAVNFTLHVSTDVYERYYNELANQYEYSRYHTPMTRRLRHYVMMDPEQDGQLIYVTDEEPEEPPAPQLTYDSYEGQELVSKPAQDVYMYQASHQYANGAGAYYQIPAQATQHQYQAQNPGYNNYYTSPYSTQYVSDHHRHAPKSSYEQGKLISSAASTQGYAYDQAGYQHDPRVPVGNTHSKLVASTQTFASGGIAYPKPKQKAGRKRRQSVALGVNA